MQLIKIKKGYQLRMAGQPDREVISLPSPSKVGLTPMWLPYIKPRLKVSEGDRVKIGSPLFEDTRNPAIVFSSPAGGTVTSIRIGSRRAIRAIEIDCAKGEEPALAFDAISTDAVGGMPRGDLVRSILKGGIWWILRQLPLRDMPDPAAIPSAILVNLAAKEPFAPLPSIYLHGHMDLFAFGLNVLGRLADNRLVVYADDRDKETRELCGQWLTHTVEGQYPADDPGVVNYHLKQSAEQNRPWYIEGQDVLLLARLLAQGKYPTERLIALGGPAVPAPRHLRTRLGVPLAHLLDHPATISGKRLVVGGCMRGFYAEPDGFMGLRETSLTVLDEGREPEFLALFNPGLNKATYSRTFLSALHSRVLRYDCNLNGGQRACIGCMHCADVCPVDILPQMVYKAILAEEVEEYLAHGLLDCVDCGLCSYVCPSKIELSQTFRETKTAYAKEQPA